MDFQVEKVLPNGLGRVGTIRMAHGEIKTPAFMAVGTQGYVRFLSAEDLRGIGAQAMLSNGFHLRRRSHEIAEAGGLAEWKPTESFSSGHDVDLSRRHGRVASSSSVVTSGDSHKKR